MIFATVDIDLKPPKIGSVDRIVAESIRSESARFMSNSVALESIQYDLFITVKHQCLSLGIVVPSCGSRSFLFGRFVSLECVSSHNCFRFMRCFLRIESTENGWKLI